MGWIENFGGNATVGIFCTGGTFDKIYDPIQERLFLSGETACDDIIRRAQVAGVSIKQIAQKDSLELTSDDIQSICTIIEKSFEQRIVVIHGTSRMTDTAEALLNESEKTIVFTGAMIPASIERTEASFNIGFALASALILPPGVWIGMNGQIFRSGEVFKNTSAGRFEKKNG